jgi:heptosyltransferase-3
MMPYINHLPVKRILLVAMPLLGDVLLATPLLRTLRCAYPKASLDILVYRGHEGILEGNPDISNVITVSERPNSSELLSLLKRLFRQYDLAASNSTSDRKVLYTVLAARTRLSVMPPARWQDAWKRILTYGWTELDDESTHSVVQNLRLSDLLGLQRVYEVVAPYAKNAAQTLDRLLPFPWPTQSYAVIHLAPRWTYKRWTISGWARLSRYLIDRGFAVVLTGGSAAQETDYIRSAMPHMPDSVVNVAGKLRFSEVAELIRSCAVYVGPDTAITHIAAATGAPTVALYGPTNPLKWAPWPYLYAHNRPPFGKFGTQRVNNVILVQGPGECVPCHEEGCDRHKQSRSRCLEELDSAQVIRAAEAFIGH